MHRFDVLADYVSDEGDRVRIVAKMCRKMGKRDGPDDLEHGALYEASSIEVRVGEGEGHVVEAVPLRKELAKFSQRATNDLMGEINALKDNGADADEVLGELHALLG